MAGEAQAQAVGGELDLVAGGRGGGGIGGEGVFKEVGQAVAVGVVVRCGARKSARSGATRRVIVARTRKRKREGNMGDGEGWLLGANIANNDEAPGAATP